MSTLELATKPRIPSREAYIDTAISILEKLNAHLTTCTNPHCKELERDIL